MRLSVELRGKTVTLRQDGQELEHEVYPTESEAEQAIGRAAGAARRMVDKGIVEGLEISMVYGSAEADSTPEPERKKAQKTQQKP